MDRRNVEAQSQLQKLKEESEITAELLNKLILACSQHVTELNKLGRSLHSKYFLALSKFQYLSHQKLLELNVELEGHLLENKLPNLEHFILVKCKTGNSLSTDTLKEIECSVPPTISLRSECATSKGDISQLNNNILPSKVNSDSDKTSFLSLSSNEIENNRDSFQKCLNMMTLLAENKDVQKKEECEPYIAPKVGLKCENMTEVDTKKDNLLTNSNGLEQSTGSEYLHCESSQNSREVPESDYSFYSDAYFYDDSEALYSCRQHSESDQSTPIKIFEKLKLLPVMSEEKFMKSLTKQPMPDLSLKPNQQKTITSESSIGTEVVENAVVEKRNLQKSHRENQIVKELSTDNKTSKVKVTRIQNRAAPKVGDFCMIGYIKSPSELYIQVIDGNGELLDLWSDQLGAIYKNSYSPFSSKTEAMNALGSFCCIKFEAYWYRTEILDWKMDAVDDGRDNVHVQLIDYGNKEVVNYNELRPLLDTFCHVPKMAQLCRLAYLYPPGSTKNQKRQDWPKQSLDALYDVCGDLNTSHFLITYVYAYEGGKPFEVDMIRLDGNPAEKKVRQILIDRGLAVPIFGDFFAAD